MTDGKKRPTANRTRQWICIASTVMLTGVQLIAQPPPVQPLALNQIEKLIQIQAPDATIAGEIRQRGLSFAPTKDTAESLRQAGAGPGTLQAIDELRPLLDEAKQAIPSVLKRIYQSLDQGDPQAVRPLVSTQIGDSADRLDEICRPFNYRAHYIQSIIERPGQNFETRVRVLFRPFEEKAQIFTFRPNHGTFFLAQVEGDRLRPEKEAAREAVRQFIFAVQGGRWDVAARYASPHLPIDQMKAPEWQEYFAKMTSAHVSSIETVADRGILLLVRVDIRERSSHLPDFLVDSATGLIVRAFFRSRENIYTKLPTPDGFTDPDLEAYTAKRFALVAPDTRPPNLPRLEQPYKVGGDVVPPAPIVRHDPPPKRGKLGDVVVRIVIDANGFVKDPKVIKSLDPDRDESAILAVKTWRFRPGTRQGVPVAVSADIAFTFSEH